MSYQVIFEKAAGSLQGSLPTVIQGSTLETITVLALYRDGSNVNLTGKTISGTATDNDGNTYTLSGTFVGANGSFTWEFSAGDVGTANTYAVVITYTDGVDEWSSDPVRFIVRPNPSATAVQNNALVGISTALSAWLSASEAGGALGTAAYEDTTAFEAALGNPSVDGYALTSTIAGVRTWAAASGGADIGNWDVNVSDTFTLDKTATNPASIILNRVLPYSLGSSWRNNLQRSANATLTDNVVGSWGWNIGNGGGNENPAFPSTYLQLESHFELTAGVGWSEYHLNFYRAGVGTGTRPFQFNMRHTDGLINAVFRGDATQFLDNAGLVAYVTFTTPASGNGQWTANNLPFDVVVTSTNAFKVGASGTALLHLDTTNQRVNVGNGSQTATFNVTGNTQLVYNPTATTGTLFGISSSVTAAHASASTGVVVGFNVAALNGSASNLASLYGAQLIARNDAAGTVATLTGLRVTAGTLTSKTATNVTGLYIEPTILGTSSFWTGTEVASPSGAGVVFIYGHRVQNLGASGINASYGIKIENQSGSGTNYALATGTGLVTIGDDIYLAAGKVIRVNAVPVLGARVIDARCDDAINSGDATTDGVIDSLRDAMIAHGLIAAA